MINYSFVLFVYIYIYLYKAIEKLLTNDGWLMSSRGMEISRSPLFGESCSQPTQPG